MKLAVCELGPEKRYVKLTRKKKTMSVLVQSSMLLPFGELQSLSMMLHVTFPLEVDEETRERNGLTRSMCACARM